MKLFASKIATHRSYRGKWMRWPPIIIQGFIFAVAIAGGISTPRICSSTNRVYYICKTANGEEAINDHGCGPNSTCKDARGTYTREECARLDGLKKQLRDEANKPKSPRWEPKIGMSAEEVARMVDSGQCYDLATASAGLRFCGCRNVNTTKTARGTREQWVFGCAGQGLRSYMYFDNGILTAIQD